MKTSPSSPYASNKEVKELYDASKKADQLGEPVLAIQLLESLLEVTPNDARIYRRLSRMYREQGDLNLARSTLQNGLRKLPKNPWQVVINVCQSFVVVILCTSKYNSLFNFHYVIVI